MNFSIGPLVIAPLYDEVHLFASTVTDITQPDLPGRRVEGHAVRAAEADRKKFFQHTAVRINERIVIGNEVIAAVSSGPACRRICAHRLAQNSMAFGRILIYVNAQDAGKQALINSLGVVVDIIGSAFVTVAQIEEAIRPEKHAATIGAQQVLIELIDEDPFGIRIRNQGAIGHREAGEAIVSGCSPYRARLPGVGRGRRVLVINVNVTAVGGGGLAKFRMKSHAEQTAIIVALVAIGETQELVSLRWQDRYQKTRLPWLPT